ncbi:MAG: tetraacyldisaccharide 4'-kinase [Bdellovibrionota bacterium]
MRPRGAVGVFRYATSTLGAKHTHAFSDHHAYSPRDIEALWKEAERVGASELLCTEKDSHKIKSLLPSPRQPCTVRLNYEFPDEFWYFLRDI